MSDLRDLPAESLKVGDYIVAANASMYVAAVHVTHGPAVVVTGVVHGLGVATVDLVKGQKLAVER